MAISTAERLGNYYPFSPEVIGVVAEVAEQQQTYQHYGQFLEAVGITDPFPLNPDDPNSQSAIDIRPSEHDSAEAIVYHLPHATPLDDNMLYQIGTIAAALPNKRIIAIGNQSGPGYSSGKLEKSQRSTVAHGHFNPSLEPVLRYARSGYVDRLDHIGYSGGAIKATASAVYDLGLIDRIVAIEPVANRVKMPILRTAVLGFNFARSAKTLNDYVKASNDPNFETARDASVSMIDYNLGLVRIGNIAEARGLARQNYETIAAAATGLHPETTLHLIWGSESELAKDGLMQAMTKRLMNKNGARIQAIRLKGQRHPLPNDIHLQAALVAQSIPAA